MILRVLKDMASSQLKLTAIKEDTLKTKTGEAKTRVRKTSLISLQLLNFNAGCVPKFGTGQSKLHGCGDLCQCCGWWHLRYAQAIEALPMIILLDACGMFLDLRDDLSVAR